MPQFLPEKQPRTHPSPVSSVLNMFFNRQSADAPLISQHDTSTPLIDTAMKNLNFSTKLNALLVSALLILTTGISWGQTNSYLGLDGGFEGSSPIDNTAVGDNLPRASKWVKANTNVTLANETGTVRSGTNSLKVSSSTTSTCRVWSPLVTFTATTSRWVVQYYRRSASTTATVQNQNAAYRGTIESLSGTYSVVTAVNTWEKVTYAPTSVTSITQGAAGLLARMAASAGDTYYDDFVMYDGTAADVTAPNVPGGATATVAVGGTPTTQLNVTWTAASGGVDGGGYLVVRGTVDPTTAPNVNGIYAVGNTIAAGMTVVYRGTGLTFTDTGLNPGTQYYYRVYTFDKAYNYSTALLGNGATSSAGFTTQADGPWTTGTTWVGNVAPTSADNVIINHIVTAGALTRNSGTTTTISAGKSLAVSGTYTCTGATTTVNGTFQLDAGGGATGANFTYGAAGTLSFNTSGSYGVNSGDVFWPTTSGPFNVSVLQGGVTLNTGTSRTVAGTFATAAGVSRFSGSEILTLSGTCQINSGGLFNFPPTYSGSASTLIYNIGGAYPTSNEWNGGGSTTPAVGPGVPGNVTIQLASTDVSLVGNCGTPGTVTISSGATLTLNAGDLYIGGNFTQNGTLVNSNKVVQFVQGNTQTISRTSGGITFDWVVINKTANNVVISNAVTVNNTLTLTARNISIGANNLTVGATSGAGSTNYVITNSTGQLNQVVAGLPVLFPVGNAAYNPITLTNSGTSDTYGIRLADANPAAVSNANKVLTKTWFITEAVPGAGDLAVVAQYNTGDARGVNYNGGTQPYIGLYSTNPSAGWTQVTSVLAGAGPVTSTGGANFTNTLAGSYFGVGMDNAFIAIASPPAISGFSASVNNGANTGYIASLITLTGSGFNGANPVTILKYGGSGGTVITPFTIVDDNNITFTATAAMTGTFYVENGIAENSTSGSSYSNLGYITTATGGWTNTLTWLGNAVPPSSTTTNVTIAHNVSNMTAARNVGSLTVNSGITLTISSVNGQLTVNANSTNSGTITLTNATLIIAGATYTNSGTINIGITGKFQINQGGFADGAGTYDYGTNGTLVFNNSSGPLPIDATHTYWSNPINVTILGAGGISLSVAKTVPSSGTTGTFLLSNTAGANSVQGASALTLNGTVQIDGGSFSTTPTYGASSTLVYNITTNTTNEWTAGATTGVTAGSGVPANVTIQSGALTLTGARGLSGNLTVSTGATLNLNSTNGNDLFTKGNLIFTGTGALAGGPRTIVFCRVSGTQTISSAAALTIPYVSISPAGGTGTTVQQTAVTGGLTISAPNPGTAVSFSTANDVFDIAAGQTLTIGTATVGNTISGNGTFKGSTTSNLTLRGDGSIGTLRFTTSFQNLGTFVMNRENAVIGATLGTPLTVNTTLTMTAGLISLGSQNLTLASAATATGNPNGFVISDIDAGTGLLRKTFTTNSAFTFPIGDNTTPDGAQYSPATLTFSGSTAYSSAWAGVRVKDDQHPNNIAPTHFISRYWELTSSGITTPTYSFVGTYLDPADVSGTEATSVAGRWNGSNWAIGSAVNTVANTLTMSAQTVLSATNHFTAGSPLTNQEINVKQGTTTYLSNGASYDFGTVGTGTNSNNVTFTIENLGAATLSITGMTQGSEFTVVTLPSFPVSVNGLATTTFQVRFNPAFNGVRTGTIVIANNDTDEGTYTLNLTGTGATPVAYRNGVYVSITGSLLDWDDISTWNRVVNRVFTPATVVPDGNTDIAYVRGDVYWGAASKSVGSLTIESGGAVTMDKTIGGGSGNGTVADSLIIKNNGTFNVVSLFTMGNGSAPDILQVEDGGNFTYAYTSTNSRTSSIWAGTERFYPNSNFEIINNQSSASFLIVQTASDVSPYPNASGYCFGNVIINKTASTSGPLLLPNGFTNKFAAGDLIFRRGTNSVRWYDGTSAMTTTIGDSIKFESTWNQTVNLSTLSGTGNITLSVLGGILNNSSGTFNLENGSGNTVVLNVDGDITINTGGLRMIGSSGNGTATINLKGDLSAGTAGLFTNSVGTNQIVNFIGTYNPLVPATIQTIDINSATNVNASIRNKDINFRVNPTSTGAYVQLLNRNFELGTDASLTVFNGGTLDFGFFGSTALNLTEVSGATTTSFDLQAGGRIKITSPNGIDAGTAAEGNVQVDTRSFNNNSVTSPFYHYIGKSPWQRLGDGLPTISGAKQIIVELEGIATQLRFEGHNGTSYTALASDVNINTNGGLTITQGTVVATETNDFLGSGFLTQTGGIYQTSETTNDVPQMTSVGTFTGGTIELNAAGDQTLKGTKDYNSLTFSNSGTKTLTGALPGGSLDTLVTIAGSAILDVADNEFSGPAGLTMTGTSRFRMSQITTLPQLTGTTTGYTLTGGTVELYGTTSTQQHTLRGTISFPVPGTNIVYNSVELNALSANLSTGPGNVNLGAGFSVTTGITVNAPAALRMNPTDVISGPGFFELKPDATLFYSHIANGISSSGATGNIQVTGSRILPATASYGFSGTGSMAGGTGLPSTVKNLYVLKNSAANVVSLGANVTVTGQLVLTSGKLDAQTFTVTVSNTATTGISGGSSSSFVSGKLARSLPSNLVSGSTYVYPLGKVTPSQTYLPLSLVNPTTGTGAVTVTLEAFNTGSGGTIAQNASSTNTMSNTEYWALSATGNFNGSQISVTRPAAVGTLNALAMSTTLGGTYNFIDGTAAGSSITNSNFTPGNTQFFAMAQSNIEVTFLTAPTPVCQYSTGNVYTTESGKTNYLWSVTGGTITAGGGTSSNTVTVTWPTSGARSVSVNYTENGFTQGSPTVQNVTVDPTPLLSTTPQIECIPTDVNLTTAYSDANLTSGTQNYYLADGTTEIFNFTNIDVNGTYWIRKTTTIGSCTDIKSVTATVRNCPITWYGTIDSDWHKPGNWLPVAVPTIGDSVNVPGSLALAGKPFPVISTNTTANAAFMRFVDDASLTIAANCTLNVKRNWIVENSLAVQGTGPVFFNGTVAQSITNGSTSFSTLRLNNTAGLTITSSGKQFATRAVELQAGVLTTNSKLELSSDASNSAYINDFQFGGSPGSLSGNVTIRRHVAGVIGYRYLSSPVQESVSIDVTSFGPSVRGIDGLVFNPLTSYPSNNTFPTCWVYNENDPSPLAQSGWVSKTAAGAVNKLQAGRGYAVIIQNSQTLSFTGSVYTNTVFPFPSTLTLTSSGNSLSDGWHLLGNPFPSPISWTAFFNANSSRFISAVKRWKTGGNYSGQYSDYTANGVGVNGAMPNIAIGQGFLVKVVNQGTYNYPNSCRVADPTTDFNDAGSYAQVNNLIRLKLAGGNGADEAVVYFDEHATNGFDNQFDAIKMLSGTVGMPGIYTTNGGDMSINVQGAFTANREIPVNMYVDVNGSYNLSVLELMNFEPTAMVYLEDRSRGTFTNLREVQQLSYNLTKGYVNNRFFLHFSAPLSTQATAESCNRNDGKVKILNPGASRWNISLQASTGEVVGTASAVSADYEFTGLADGNYTVKFETGSGYVVYQQVAVEAGQNLNTGFAASTQVVSSGSEVEFTAELNAANTAYVWNFGDGIAVIAGAVVQHTYDAPGIYTVSLSLSSGGCTSVTEHSISVLTATGIANTDGEKAFKLYPNPATDLISVQLSDASKFAPEWIEIQDAAGRTISREIAKDMIANGRKTLNVSNLANGVYQIVLGTKDARFVRSFVVAH